MTRRKTGTPTAWVNLGLAPPNVTAANGPDTINRVGSFVGLAAPSAGDRETARLLGMRVAEAAVRWTRGAQPTLSQAA